MGWHVCVNRDPSLTRARRGRIAKPLAMMALANLNKGRLGDATFPVQHCGGNPSPRPDLGGGVLGLASMLSGTVPTKILGDRY